MQIVPDSAVPPRQIPPDEIAKAKSDHPDWQLVSLTDERNGDEFLFRIPSAGDYARFKSLVSDETMRPTAMKLLVYACAIYPTGPDFATLALTQPGLVDTFGNKLLEHAGLNVAVTVKKL
jgi:hypothetical protein